MAIPELLADGEKRFSRHVELYEDFGEYQSGNVRTKLGPPPSSWQRLKDNDPQAVGGSRTRQKKKERFFLSFFLSFSFEHLRASMCLE